MINIAAAYRVYRGSCAGNPPPHWLDLTAQQREAMSYVAGFCTITADDRELVLLRKIEALIAENHSLAAGCCHFRSGDPHGNPYCLAAGKLVELLEETDPTP